MRFNDGDIYFYSNVIIQLVTLFNTFTIYYYSLIFIFKERRKGLIPGEVAEHREFLFGLGRYSVRSDERTCFHIPHIISSGRIAAILAKNMMIPTTGQSAACASVHPVVFAAFSVVIAPGIVDANI
jgi:hypothetical protein